ncbi:Tetraspanin-9 [Bienertia sinuspersici]
MAVGDRSPGGRTRSTVWSGTPSGCNTKAIVEANLGNKFSKEYEFDTLDVIHTKMLTHFEAGCCVPPEDCSFNYTSATIWIKPENGNYTDVDCNRWDNDPNTLCYGCQTCKAAFLQDVTSNYFMSGIILLCVAAPKFLFLACVTWYIYHVSSGRYTPLT